MLSMYGLKLVEEIDPSRENAFAIQRLVLQDAKNAEFKDPYKVANPGDRKRVSVQLDKLLAHPERYSGVVQGEKLVAYMKHAPWYTGDERPFATGLLALECHARHLVHRHRPMDEWGVFGLVASTDLRIEARDAALSELLQHSFRDPWGAEKTTNVIIHAHDPLLRIAEDLGFARRGRKGRATGAPGLMQLRYKRPIYS